MKPILIYDTETSGLPLWKEPSDDPRQPHIIQICAELVDDDTQEVYGQFSTLIRPDGWTIPAEIEDLTGISTERAFATGMNIHDAMRPFFAMWKLSAFRVAHNESFDARMVRIEIKRAADHYQAAFDDEWKDALSFCTQVKSTPILKLPATPRMHAAGRHHHKSANLTEAFGFFTGLNLPGAHNAMNDVMACKDVYFGIKAWNEGRHPKQVDGGNSLGATTPAVAKDPFE